MLQPLNVYWYLTVESRVGGAGVTADEPYSVGDAEMNERS